MIILLKDMEVEKIVNNTEKLVLSVLDNYHDIEVPQLIFKEFDNSTIKKAFKSLKDKGLICKKSNLLDMRQKYIILTEAGIHEINKQKGIVNTS